MKDCLFYPHVYFEISDACNALCPWCERGSRNRQIRPPIKDLKSRGNKFIPLELFTETMDFLLNKGLVRSGESFINVYNWGEPLLHPQFYDIASYLRDKKLFLQISTNGSIVIEKKVPLDHVNFILISMPGFSQDSYDKVHGFSFKKIIQNITLSVKNAQESGCSPSSIYLYVHEYKHNKNEIQSVKEFSESLGISFTTQKAFFNCFAYTKQYVQNTLPKHILKQAQEELFLPDREHFIQPETVTASRHMCTQWQSLALSHRGRPSVCCTTDLESEAYELFDFKDHPHISYEEINEIRKNHHFCQLCRAMGLNRTA